MTSNLESLLYLISAMLFIFSLKGLSSPKTARMGNWAGIIGMALAILTSFFSSKLNLNLPMLVCLGVGAVVGLTIACKIKMTSMPQLVAGFHSLVGLAAVLIASAALIAPESYGIGISNYLKIGNLLEIGLGASIGAITFTGSLVAFGKLQGLITGKALRFPGQNLFNLLLLLSCLGSLYIFCSGESYLGYLALVVISLIMGVFLIMPIGGADMPVIVSMLNSYSGWASVGIGFTLSNNLLIITGSLVGASGAILSYIMCKAMNRSFFSVIFGGFGESNSDSVEKKSDNGVTKNGSAEDAAYIMRNASSVIIVPGYGMAVSQAQYAVREMADDLMKIGVKVKYAIHPVAGRMPGHMNVLLAEANVDYDQVLELEEINRDFATTDVVYVIGANDITNPAAKNDVQSPIYGMPILDVSKAKTILFVKRGMAPGYAGIDNELFYYENTIMLFGDAKKVTEEILKYMEEN